MTKALRRSWRTYLQVAIVVMAVAALAALVSDERDYCRFCGMDSKCLVVRWAGLRIRYRKDPSRLSDALEPLVHATGGPHSWVCIERTMFLAFPLEALRNHFTRWHYNIDMLRFRCKGPLVALTKWDPELAVGAARGILAPEGERVWELVEPLRRLAYASALVEPGPQDLNDLRAMVGLPPREGSGESHPQGSAPARWQLPMD